mgnify:CR=1 FL=1
MKRILLTTGEPAGIGPDLCVQMAQYAWPFDLTVIGHPKLLSDRAEQLGIPLQLLTSQPETPTLHRPGTLNILPTVSSCSSRAGVLNPSSAAYVLETVEKSTRFCESDIGHALVTPPVHKGIINQAGYHFTGHTEFIAELVGGYPVMMLAAAAFRVALVTTHIPLSEVSAAITPERLGKTLEVLQQDMQTRFGIPDPRIRVCGLNPHAGEGGYLGREELDIMEPVLDRLRSKGMNLVGPLPADTVFLPRYIEEADVILALYHDQGLPVLKHAGFGQAVNITLGLPIIRTSVDHGTALDLAGTGKADTGSLQAALSMAHTLANNS